MTFANSRSDSTVSRLFPFLGTWAVAIWLRIAVSLFHVSSGYTCPKVIFIGFIPVFFWEFGHRNGFQEENGFSGSCQSNYFKMLLVLNDFHFFMYKYLSYEILNMRYHVVCCTNSSYKYWFSTSLKSSLWWNSKLKFEAIFNIFFPLFLTLSSYPVFFWYFPCFVNWVVRTLLKALL